MGLLWLAVYSSFDDEDVAYGGSAAREVAQATVATAATTRAATVWRTHWSSIFSRRAHSRYVAWVDMLVNLIATEEGRGVAETATKVVTAAEVVGRVQGLLEFLMGSLGMAWTQWPGG